MTNFDEAERWETGNEKQKRREREREKEREKEREIGGKKVKQEIVKLLQRSLTATLYRERWNYTSAAVFLSDANRRG
jgi:hypothetical protein